MFRGDSHAFVLIDVDTRKPCYYDQTIFALFDVDDAVQDWRLLSLSDKEGRVARVAGPASGNSGDPAA